MPSHTKNTITLWFFRKKFNRQTALHYSIITIFMLLNISTPTHGTALAQPSDTNGLSTLHVRLSSKAIRPPQELVISTLKIPNMAIARPIVGPPSKAAILENDQRHRTAVLTSEENGDLTVYVLDHIDLTPHRESLRALVENRGCAHDRMTITGGLGCVAICLKEIIEAEYLP
ncbi:hypothetical protein [Nitrospira sp. M1]